ncbi:MAG: NEW3 domain-containing protein [Acidobacteria bacterium]|nr:NEW3 domain-containing protein [Acidobacteriota bacterium]MDW7984102.1 NEW3 domain-containing protein [Acidobacteriota bacterium]
MTCVRLVRSSRVLRKGLLIGVTGILLSLLLGRGVLTVAQDVPKIFQLQRARIQLDEARKDYDRAIRMREVGLISEEDFSRKEAAYRRAQVEFQEALVQALGGLHRVLVVAARKWVDEWGRIHVRVVLRHAGPDADLLKSWGSGDSPLPVPLELRDVYVSLLRDGLVVSDPYQVRIPSLSPGQTSSVEFILLKDAEAVEVLLLYAGREDRQKVLLMQVASQGVRVMVKPPSQEADLGGTAAWEVSLERFAGADPVCHLRVVGLPSEVVAEFLDPQTSARWTQVRFPEGTTNLRLTLRLYLPPEPTEQVRPDRSVRFAVLCLPEAEAARLPASAGLSDLERAELPSPEALVEVIPRGVGRLAVEVPNFYLVIRPDQAAEVEVTVQNVGTRRVDNVRLPVQAPLDWRFEVALSSIPSLEPAGEARVRLRLWPPRDLPMGDYEARLRVEALSVGRPVTTDEKVLRIHVTGRSGGWGLGLLIVVLVGLCLGIVLWGIRLTRRH